MKGHQRQLCPQNEEKTDYRERERELWRYRDKGNKGKETERQTGSESKRDNEEYEKLDCLCQILYSSIKLFFNN